MQLSIAIIFRELIGWPRHKRFYIRRLAFVGVAGVVVLAAFGRQWAGYGDAIGLELFRALAVVSMVMACFAAPAAASAYFAREKQMKTLGLLLIADISPLQLVISRLVGSLFLVFISCFSILPLFVLCIRLGGLSTSQIFMSFAILFATVCVGTAMGLLISALMMDEMMAFFGSLVTSACLFITLPGIIFLMGQDFPTEFYDVWIMGRILPAISPYYAVHGIFSFSADNIDPLMTSQDALSMAMAPGFWFLLSSTVMTAVLVLITTLILPSRAHAPTHIVDPRHAANMQSARKSRVISGNPLVWKETPDTGYSLFYFSMTAGILLALPIGMNHGKTVFAVGIAIFAVSAVIVGLGLLVRGALAFVHEREMRTFELLLISGLGEEDIVLGKYWGYIKCYLPWLISMVLGFILMSLYEDFWKIAIAYLLFITLLFAYFNLAFVLSLVVRRIVALLTAFFCFVVWAVAGPLLILRLDQLIWTIVGIIVVHLIIGCILFEAIFRIFQRHSHQAGFLSHHHWSA